MENFYDKVANKYGGYGFTSNLPKHTSVYPDGDPEKVFKDKLLHLASKSTVALDVGCGDGKFTFEVANSFSSIIGLDSSSELLNIAEQKKKRLGLENVSFRFGDARNTPFPAETFDLIFNRRGPIFEDFDFEKDEKYLNQYFSEFMQGDQVILSRHRVVSVVQK